MPSARLVIKSSRVPLSASTYAHTEPAQLTFRRLPFQFLHWSRGRELNRVGRDKKEAGGDMRRSGSLRSGSLSLAPARNYDSLLFI